MGRRSYWIVTDSIGSEEIDKPVDVEPWAPGIVRNDIELAVVPLHPGFVLRSRTEQVVPGTLQRAVPHLNLIAPGEGRKGLQIGIVFVIAPQAVPQINGIVLVELVIETAGCQVRSRAERKHAAVLGELVDHKTIQRSRGRIHRQQTGKCGRTCVRREEDRWIWTVCDTRYRNPASQSLQTVENRSLSCAGSKD